MNVSQNFLKKITAVYLSNEIDKSFENDNFQTFVQVEIDPNNIMLLSDEEMNDAIERASAIKEKILDEIAALLSSYMK